MSDPTPPGWIRVPISDVADLNPRHLTPEPHDGDLVSFIPMAAVEELSGRMDPSRHRPWREVRKGFVRFQDGDVLFAKITPCMENGKFALARGLAGGRAAGSTEFHVLRSTGAVVPEYILYFLLQEGVRREARARMQGVAGQLRVPRDYLAELLFPLAPLAEQRRIVAAIEEHLSRLDAAVAGLKRVQAQLPRYRAAVLRAAVDGRLGNTTGGAVQWIPLRKVVESLDQGWSPKCLRHSAAPDEWGVMKTTAVQPLAFDAEANKRLPDALTPRPQLQVREGDVLVTRAGPRARAGVSCVVPATRSRLLLCDKVYRLRVKRAELRPGWLGLVLNSPRLLAALETIKTGMSDSGVNLTQDRLLNLPVPVPPLEMQEEMENQVDRALSIELAIDMEISAALARSRQLRRSILAAAFRGKLVRQDRNDEPASALLERIRAGRAAGPAPKRKPRASTARR